MIKRCYNINIEKVNEEKNEKICLEYNEKEKTTPYINIYNKNNQSIPKLSIELKEIDDYQYYDEDDGNYKFSDNVSDQFISKYYDFYHKYVKEIAINLNKPSYAFINSMTKTNSSFIKDYEEIKSENILKENSILYDILNTFPIYKDGFYKKVFEISDKKSIPFYKSCKKIEDTLYKSYYGKYGESKIKNQVYNDLLSINCCIGNINDINQLNKMIENEKCHGTVKSIQMNDNDDKNGEIIDIIGVLKFKNLENFTFDGIKRYKLDESLDTIPSEFWNNDNLKTVSLNFLEMKMFPSNFVNSKSLESLSIMSPLCNYPILKVKDGDLSNLKIFQVNSEKMEEEDIKEIFKIKNLEELHMMNYNKSVLEDNVFPSGISNLSNLKKFILSYSYNVEEFSDEINMISGLSYIFLNNNKKLVKFPIHPSAEIEVNNSSGMYKSEKVDKYKYNNEIFFNPLSL